MSHNSAEETRYQPAQTINEVKNLISIATQCANFPTVTLRYSNLELLKKLDLPTFLSRRYKNISLISMLFQKICPNRWLLHIMDTSLANTILKSEMGEVSCLLNSRTIREDCWTWEQKVLGKHHFLERVMGV